MWDLEVLRHMNSSKELKKSKQLALAMNGKTTGVRVHAPFARGGEKATETHPRPEHGDEGSGSRGRVLRAQGRQ